MRELPREGEGREVVGEEEVGGAGVAGVNEMYQKHAILANISDVQIRLI